MIVEHGGIGNAAPNPVELGPAHLDDGIGHLARQLQMRSVALSYNPRIETLIEDLDQIFTLGKIGVGPIEELVK